MTASFIEIYDGMISRQECALVRNWFDSSSDQCKGMCYDTEGNDTVIEENKKDVEIPFLKLNDESLPSRIILPKLKQTLKRYHLKYETSLESIAPWSLEENYNLQRYMYEDDGFKMLHCEAGGLPSSNRILAWMVYFNTAKSGTHFTHFPNVKSKEGRIVIWPASWTHTHKSEPNLGIKYLATGWVSFLHCH